MSGIPLWLCVRYSNWKNKKPSEKDHWLFVFRNPYLASMCPVLVLLSVIATTGWKGKGPIFGNLDKHGLLLVADREESLLRGAKVERVWVTATKPGGGGSKRVNFSSDQLGRMSERAFDALGLFHCTDHLWRVSFCAWSAQCGALMHEAILTAKWDAHLSAEWIKYFDAGHRKLLEFDRSKDRDKLRSILPYPEHEGGMLASSHHLDPETDMTMFF
jgi:hypothetical protein